MSNIISVSISSQQALFLDETGISPSKLLQDCINNAIESQKISQQNVIILKSRIEDLLKVIYKQRDYIENKGLMDEFSKL